VVFNLFRKPESPDNETRVDETPGGLSDLLKFIVIRLVDNPDDVEIKEVEGGKNTVFELKVNEADMGKVIGKKGRIIKALRIVMRAAALHGGQSISVELMNSSPDSESPASDE
jgi:predicted RNA-binding protein YlqC (UPF0109 family)